MLGDELRAIRESRQLSLREVARVAGVSHSALVAIENGSRYPSLHTLERLAECLQITFIIGPTETIIEPLG
jgi:transcriptional regulator with XRE-family HTH domain